MNKKDAWFYKRLLLGLLNSAQNAVATMTGSDEHVDAMNDLAVAVAHVEGALGGFPLEPKSDLLVAAQAFIDSGGIRCSTTSEGRGDCSYDNTKCCTSECPTLVFLRAVSAAERGSHA